MPFELLVTLSRRAADALDPRLSILPTASTLLLLKLLSLAAVTPGSLSPEVGTLPEFLLVVVGKRLPEAEVLIERGMKLPRIF
jgi:hypothetical protein